MRPLVLSSALLVPLLAFPAAPVAAQRPPPPIYSEPCTGGRPCVSPPPEIMARTGYSAPGLVMESPPPRFPGSYKHSFAAIAFWRGEDGEYGYTSGGQRTDSREKAEALAIRECEYKGGRNCTIALWGGNGYFAIVRDSTGRIHAGFSGELEDARQVASDACNKVASDCQLIETVDSSARYSEY